VFVGYNNSGKTYVSQLLWAIFNEKTIEKFSKSVAIQALNIENRSSFEISQSLINTLLNHFSTFLTEKVVPETFHISKKHLILADFSVQFAFELDEFTHLKNTANIRADDNQNDYFTFSKEAGSLTVTVKANTSGKKQFADNFSNETLLDKQSVNSSAVVDFLLRLILNSTQAPFFLPSNRLVYLVFYQYFFRMEKEKKQKMDKLFLELMDKQERGEAFSLESLSINAFKSPYTEALDMLFDKVYQLNENATAHTHYQHLMADLTKIMGGDIVMKKSLGIAPLEFYLKMPKQDQDLEMYLSSSSVNQLSTLYLYLKYWALTENNFLMIDEPEENLHPKHQIALLNVLLCYANLNNNRVLMTTHSPLLADMVNNYHYMAFLKSTQVPMNLAMENYSEMNLDINLSIEDMGIYFFDGTQIQTYEMGNYGVFFEDFYYEIRKVKDISNMLTDKIYDLMNQEDS